MRESSWDAVARATEALHGWQRPWGVAGGWALDLWRGRVTRPHSDLDIAVLREHQHELRDRLAHHQWSYVENRVHRPWAGERLELPIHELVATRGADRMELLLNERDGADWVFRRDARVRVALNRAFLGTSTGLPALAPEIVLLYKSKAPRPVDDADFAEHAPALDTDARAWLANALRICYPTHPWFAALQT